MTNRWDETWHRLREWTNGQAPSERLAAQILLSDGYESLDPSHPLGGPDGGKDAVCRRDGKTWVMAVYFPRGQQTLTAIKKKLTDDLTGVASNGADALVFVTNQELTLSERDALKESGDGVPIDVFHLDRVTTILDQPKMAAVRKQFLAINEQTSVAGPLHRFLHICGMVRVQAPDWQAAQRECAQLYADLGGGPEAGYVCTTAYVWFVRRDYHIVSERQRFQSAREDAEGHLRDPAAPWKMPSSGPIHEYALAARAGAGSLGNPIWLQF